MTASMVNINKLGSLKKIVSQVYSFHIQSSRSIQDCGMACGASTEIPIRNHVKTTHDSEEAFWE